MAAAYYLYSYIQIGDDAMKNSKKAFRNLLNTVDVVNTFSGGMAASALSVTRAENGLVYSISTPGISHNNLGVNVHDNYIYVYHNIDFRNKEIPTQIDRIPHVLQIIKLPFYADLDKIYANYHNDVVQVHVPQNGKMNGYDRQINISLN